MDWQKLDLTKASVLKREVDVVLQKMYDTNPEVNKSKLCSAVQYRIQELENFCAANNDDERIILFEKERLRLRKALQSQPPASRDSRSVNTNDRSASPSNTTPGGKLNNANARTPISQGLVTAASNTPSVTSRTMPSPRPSVPNSTANSVSPTPQTNRSLTGTRSNANTTAITENRSSMGHSKAIYAWEENNEIRERVPIEINEVTFLPSKQVGFYNRQDVVQAGFDTTTLPEKYVDFQIILSPEELTTLAARKKAASNRMAATKGAPQSMNSSTPYVDPRRIYKDHLRPNNPDRWISSEGIRPYKKGEKL